MPKRTKQELQERYKDLMEIRKTLNWLSTFGELWPTPGNGKTWSEEKEIFYNRGIHALNELIISGKVKSCECKAILKQENLETLRVSELKGFWNHTGRHMLDSHEYKIGNFSVEQLLDILEDHFVGKADADLIEDLNTAFDEVGKDACMQRACAPIRRANALSNTNLIAATNYNVSSIQSPKL